MFQLLPLSFAHRCFLRRSDVIHTSNASTVRCEKNGLSYTSLCESKRTADHADKNVLCFSSRFFSSFHQTAARRQEQSEEKRRDNEKMLKSQSIPQFAAKMDTLSTTWSSLSADQRGEKSAKKEKAGRWPVVWLVACRLAGVCLSSCLLASVCRQLHWCTIEIKPSGACFEWKRMEPLRRRKNNAQS